MKIAIVGPDGSGKSSICEALSRHIESTKVVYAGKREFNNKLTDWALRLWIKTSKRSSILGVFAQYMIYYPIEFWENYSRFSKTHNGVKVIIFDRHPIDRIIMKYEFHTKFELKKIRHLHFLFEFPMRAFWGFIYYRLFVQVDHIFLILPTSEVIYERAEDQYNDLQEVQARRDAYRHVCKKARFLPVMRILDILKEDSVEDICQVILGHINTPKKSRNVNSPI